MNLNKGPGRPKKYELNEKLKQEILYLLKIYNQDHNPYPQIKYKHIWEYANHLYEQGTFSIKTSYDFWKKKDRIGRQLVDTVNTIQSQKVSISESIELDLINIKELIDKYGGKNKKLLWEYLEPYDKHLYNIASTIKQLEDKNNTLQNKLNKQEWIIQTLKQKNYRIQKTLLAMFTYSNKENELVNMLNTGSSKSPIINLALQDTFENPISFIQELEKHLEYQAKQHLDPSKVIPLHSINKSQDNTPEYDL
ncbi:MULTISPECIES: hypothetical protein [Bacillus]|uniref:hypothetical protein n=1 Tax=Bacillus TaxID=1386 RepID=UPI0018CE1AF8|nr:hypothetical protein [Bacillus thuringiensis]MED3467650.1 hypothetical protein [Bacillus thuringiensis]HDR3896449.1 hypothetical protein [Bacillus cereus]